MPWSSHPGARVATTLFVEAFGRLSEYAASRPTRPGEDLYSVFSARADSMGWGGAPGRPQPVLWGMHEGDLTTGSGAGRIGFVQVGLEPGVEPVTAMPPLLQCFDDGLSRFGAIEVKALQVTGMHLRSSRSCVGDLVSWLNWYNAAPGPASTAVLAVDGDLFGHRPEAGLLANLQRWNTGGFEFGPLVDLEVGHLVEVSVGWGHLVPKVARSGFGVSVTMPEWTASAVGWVLASVLEAARPAAGEERGCAIRVTRTG